MPQIAINVTLELTDADAAAVCDTLGCLPADLNARLASHGAAALREYVEMYAGQAMTSAADLRERRLVAILLEMPAAEFPSDNKIARLFNLTVRQARTLLRTTLSRHRNRLRSALDGAARQFLAACQQQDAGGPWEARFPNAVVVELLNDRLAASAQPRSPIRRKPGTFDTYIVPNGSRNELLALYP
jgi:hypothetical protein